MAALSFRDRFFSPAVARAVTSPSGFLALGAGAAVGIIAAPAALPLTVLGALVGGAVGYGARIAVALPKKGTGHRIDSSAVGEPWRQAVKDAVAAQGRFAGAVQTFRAGPVRDNLAGIGGRLDDAIDSCWKIATQGQALTDARAQIDDRRINWELSQARYAVPKGGQPDATQASTISALQAQLASAARLDATITSTRDQLRLLNARLDETVTRAIELSVSDETSGAAQLSTDVGAIVDGLEALRQAIGEVDQPGSLPAT